MCLRKKNFLIKAMQTRILLIAVMLTGLTSCKTNIDSQLLSGTWKPNNEAGLSTYSTITFLGKDTVIAKTYDYGRLSSEVSGTYQLDPKSATLTTSYGDSISYKLEIRNLSKTELELYYLKTKQSRHYLRAD
jgi:hypothetical protein